jgi:hypothetical protein
MCIFSDFKYICLLPQIAVNRSPLGTGWYKAAKFDVGGVSYLIENSCTN